jgi:excisionase family DNA binding protein
MVERLLTIPEAAEICGLSTKTLYSLVAVGEVPAARIGRSVRIPPASLREWILAKTQAGARTAAANGIGATV